jgi:imidazolonepropionase-like amidohydrolase
MLVAGTDPVNPKLLPGFAIKREIELIHEAGIPIIDAIKSATLNAAKALSKEDEIGSIEPGKIADLVFLDGDPYYDLSNIWKVNCVMKEGNIYYPDSLRLSVKHSINIGGYKLPETSIN